jgi:hypothetical protein
VLPGCYKLCPCADIRAYHGDYWTVAHRNLCPSMLQGCWGRGFF